MRIVSAITLLCVAISGCSQRNESPQAPAADTRSASAPQPVASVKQIMRGITIPASNAVFAVAGTPPADDVAWLAVEDAALAVAESGNLLLMKPRAKDEPEWGQFALAMVNAAARAAEVARTKDAEKTGIAGDDLYNVCEQCHAKYLPKT